MTTRAIAKLGSALRGSYDAAADITAPWTPVKFVTDDDHVTPCAPDDALMIGWSEYAVDVSVAGKRQANVVFDGTAIIPVKVGTGGTATRGKLAVGVSTGGYTDAPTLGGGTTLRIIRGRFLQSGIEGDVVGMLIGIQVPSVSS